MPNTINYVTQFSNRLRELYGQALTCDPLYHSNTDIQIIGSKDIKIPTLSVSGYKDHTRASLGFSQGNYANAFETKTLDHDRSIEFPVDPMDVDETDSILSLANIQRRFEEQQAIPELDCYTYSKLYSEAKRLGSTIKTTTLNKIVGALQNVLPKLIETVFKTYSKMCGKPFENIEIEVPFGEYANPSFESQVETVGKGRTQGIMSVEACVDELYGDTKTDEWKAAEVERIKSEQGVEEMPEPTFAEV